MSSVRRRRRRWWHTRRVYYKEQNTRAHNLPSLLRQFVAAAAAKHACSMNLAACNAQPILSPRRTRNDRRVYML